jgi:hypothetical protein
MGKLLYVSMSKKLYSHFLELAGSRNGFEKDSRSFQSNKNKFQYTYFAFGVGLGSGLIGVVSPRQLKQSH